MSIVKRLLEMPPSKKRDEIEESLGITRLKIKKTKKVKTTDNQGKLDI
jgi:hypothetical protein